MAAGHAERQTRASTLSRAMAFARSVNLRAQDLPRAIASGEEAGTARSAFTDGVTRCGGGLPGWEAGSVHSAKFLEEATGNIALSAVHTIGSARVARERLAADVRPRVRRCLAKAFRALGPAGALVRKRFIVSPLRERVRGVTMVGVRLAITIVHLPNSQGGSRRTTRLDEDILGFVSGANEIALTDTYAVHDPFATGVERKLLQLLHTRAARAV